MAMFLVTLSRTGPRWQPGAPLEAQAGWAEHAAFMDGLVEQGLLVLGGPLDDVRVVHAIEAGSEREVRDALERDPWSGSHLRIERVEPWTIRLDGTRR
jgi:hypothetical protein